MNCCKVRHLKTNIKNTIHLATLYFYPRLSLFAPRIHMARCGPCQFKATHEQDKIATSAFVLYFGTDDVAKIAREKTKASKSSLISTVSAYCPTCRCVTWISRDSNMSTSLLNNSFRLVNMRNDALIVGKDI